MTTTQGPKSETTIKLPLHRYAVSFQLRYKAKSNRGLVLGYGQTSMMSSQDIVLAPGMD